MEIWVEFVRPKSFSIQSLVVRLFTWSKFSHCRIRIKDTTGGAVFETNPPKASYVPESLHDTQNSYKICNLLKIKISKEELERSHAFIKANVGKEYDWPSICRIALIKILPFTKSIVYDKQGNIQSFFCSELCLEYIEEIKQIELSTYDESVDPQKLYKILNKSGLVYEGN